MDAFETSRPTDKLRHVQFLFQSHNTFGGPWMAQSAYSLRMVVEVVHAIVKLGLGTVAFR